MRTAEPKTWRARKPFSFNGKSFRSGVSIDLSKLGASSRKLKQLIDGRFIVPGPEKEETAG